MATKKKSKTYKGKSTKFGGGGAWQQMEDAGVPPGVIYKAGVKKHGKAAMSRVAAAGRKRAAAKRKAK